MRERLIELRKELGLTQTAFAKGLSLSPSNISNWERGSYEPASSVITLISKMYGCDETWLRTGEGEMFPPRGLREEVADYMGWLLASSDASSDFQLRFIKLLSEIPSEFWPVVEEKARAILFGESGEE